MIEFGHGTHVGLRRRRNEDTYCADVGTGLFLVADGMGGHAHGERASALARDGVAARIRRGLSLAPAIREANRDILEQRDDSADMLPMGTTVAALHIVDKGFEAAWVGDSRIYLVQDGMLHPLSHDQSLAQKLVERGVLNEAEAADDPRRNILTQALGVTSPEALGVETVSGHIVADMRFLLCSDGLTEEVDDAALASVMARDDIAAQEVVDHLLLMALDAGGRDNVTAIVVRCRPD